MPHDHGSSVHVRGGSGAVRWAAGTVSKKKGYGPDPSCQPCPDCGGLECLCRPRFFAGQLLTEQDLNWLDHYITEKHKLHNRHLFGSGVVCGLVVTCAPCDERVNVSPGYALSPCGEDIVVCKPDSVDICALIARCRDDVDQDCRPYAGGNPCDDVEEDWVLAIRYIETPSMPRTPIVGPANCACGAGGCKGKSCSCGGGCGCSGSSSGAANDAEAVSSQQPRLRRGAPPTCEPTVTCEAYRYDVFRKPEEKPRDPGGRDPGANDGPASIIIGSLAGFFELLEGEMAARIACCLRDLERSLLRPPGDFNTMTLADRQAWFRWCCAVRSSLISYLARTGGTDCEAIDKLGAVVCPSPDLPLDAFKAGIAQSVLVMLGPTFEAMLQCICLNILPPCPCPEDPRVPLAVVTIRKRDCHIIKVCNWTPLRRHVVTFPTLGYWLGWIPLRRILRDLMEQICCQVFDFGGIVRDDNVVGRREAAPRGEFDVNIDHLEPLKQPSGLNLNMKPVTNSLVAKAFFRQLAMPDSVGGTTVTREDLFDLVLRRPAYAISEGLDGEDEEKAIARLAGSPLMKVLGGLARSTEGLLPKGTGLDIGRGPGPSPPRDGLEGTEIEELKRAVEIQAKDIAELKARLAGGEDTPPSVDAGKSKRKPQG